MQKDKIRISNPEAAKALRDSPVLSRFLEPRTASEIAKQLGMPANLVHHHAKRAVELGLLFIAKQEGRKIYYQLAAKTFTHKRDLLTLEQKLGADLAQISEVFLEAYLRSESDSIDADDPDYDVYGFADEVRPTKPPSKDSELREPSLEHPAHFQAATVLLSVAQYQKLMKTLAGLLEEAKPEKDGTSCSIVLFGFTGEWRKGHNNCLSYSSFVWER